MECKKKGSPKITLKAFCLTIKRIPKVKIFYPELCILQLSRRDSRPAVKLKAGDEVCAGVEQEADALHGEVLALGALEVPQLAQAGGGVDNRYQRAGLETCCAIFLCHLGCDMDDNSRDG